MSLEKGRLSLGEETDTISSIYSPADRDSRFDSITVTECATVGATLERKSQLRFQLGLQAFDSPSIRQYLA